MPATSRLATDEASDRRSRENAPPSWREAIHAVRAAVPCRARSVARSATGGASAPEGHGLHSASRPGYRASRPCPARRAPTRRADLRCRFRPRPRRSRDRACRSRSSMRRAAGMRRPPVSACSSSPADDHAVPSLAARPSRWGRERPAREGCVRSASRVRPRTLDRRRRVASVHRTSELPRRQIYRDRHRAK